MNSITLVSYIIAAAIPALAIYLIYLLDLFGTGKFSTVLISFGWGALIAFNAAFAINNVFIDAIGRDSVVRFTAPVVEEMLKAGVLVYFITRPRFRYIVDGAIYGFAAGIGFAVLENFLYISREESALSSAISRVLTASLMHATASALVGIAIGRLRRSVSGRKYTWPLLGLVLAILLHMGYNNAVQLDVEPSLLLLIGISIGTGGSFVIGVLINQGLSEEKRRFAETLGLEQGVTNAERKYVQGLGSNAIEEILDELANFFGNDKVVKIRRLLVIQANIGILSNNLRSPSSDRMKRAWQQERDELQQEANQLRGQIGVYVMSFLRSIFPDDDEQTWDAISQEAAEFDPSQVHKFDLFVHYSEVLGTQDARHLEEVGARLKQIEMFSHVDLADLENLSRAIVERQYRDGERIFKQGDEGDAMYMITQGAIGIYVDDGSGQEKRFRTYYPGSVVGEMALLDGQPRSATARASGALRVMVLRRQHLLMFLNSRPRCMMAVLEFLAERVRYTTHVVEDTISRASAIAQGDYEAVRNWDDFGDEAPAEIVAETTDVQPEVVEPAEVLETAPKVIGGAFAALAAALETREQQPKS